MADQILIRDLPDGVKPALRRRAAAHGRSMEAEARTILIEATRDRDTSPVAAWLDSLADLEPGEPLPEPERLPGRDLPEFP
jgi:plasmid stability protein